MKTGETRGYVLTFRCVNCGRHDVFAHFPTEHITLEGRIRERIYQVTCNSCGWSGDVCGLSEGLPASWSFGVDRGSQERLAGDVAGTGDGRVRVVDARSDSGFVVTTVFAVAGGGIDLQRTVSALCDQPRRTGLVF